MKLPTLFGLVVCIGLLIPTSVVANQDIKVNFEFQIAIGDQGRVSIANYTDKPILIEWGASWCSVCRHNQKEISKIYDDYKDKINFISISVSSSGDQISDVKEMMDSRGYNWTFGLDTAGYSGDHDVWNGFTWLVDSNQILLKTWNGTIVPAEQLTAAFEQYFGFKNNLGSEGLIVGDNSLIMMAITPVMLIAIIRRRRI